METRGCDDVWKIRFPISHRDRTCSHGGRGEGISCVMIGHYPRGYRMV